MIAKYGQSIFDIYIQNKGCLEGIYDLFLLNDNISSIDDDVYNLELNIPFSDNEIIRYFSKKNYSVTTLLDDYVEDENIQLKDESQEEVEAFVNSLSSKQFDMISGFMNSIPRIKYEQVFNCESCNEENKLELQGIQDFFS